MFTDSTRPDSLYRLSAEDQSSNPIHELFFLFSGSIRDDWFVQRPVSLKLERDDDGSYIISEDVFNIYGQGDFPREAQEDFIAALTEYYDILKHHANADQATREALDRFVKLWLPPA